MRHCREAQRSEKKGTLQRSYYVRFHDVLSFLIFSFAFCFVSLQVFLRLNRGARQRGPWRMYITASLLHSYFAGMPSALMRRSFHNNCRRACVCIRRHVHRVALNRFTTLVVPFRSVQSQQQAAIGTGHDADLREDPHGKNYRACQRYV